MPQTTADRQNSLASVMSISTHPMTSSHQGANGELITKNDL